jgi:hypothetical protein
LLCLSPNWNGAAGAVAGKGCEMDDAIIDINMKGAPACGRCFMLVARYAPQVVASTATYHRECFEAWYFGRYGKRTAAPRTTPRRPTGPSRVLAR